MLVAVAVLGAAVVMLLRSVWSLSKVLRYVGSPNVVIVSPKGIELHSVRVEEGCRIWERTDISGVGVEIGSVGKRGRLALRIYQSDGQCALLVCERMLLEVPNELQRQLGRYLPMVAADGPTAIWPTVYAL